MKKKKLSGLNLNKKVISSLQIEAVKGGATKGLTSCDYLACNQKPTEANCNHQ